MKSWIPKVLAAGLGLIVALALFSAYPVALLVLACTLAAVWITKSEKTLLVPLAAVGTGVFFALAVMFWTDILGEKAPVVWWSWFISGPLSSPANRAGRIGVIAGSLIGLAAALLKGRFAGWGAGHTSDRVHGLKVVSSAAKGTSRWAGEKDVAHVADFGPPREGKYGGGTVVGMFAPLPRLGEKPKAGIFNQGRIVRIRPEKCTPPLPAHVVVAAGTGAGKTYSFVIPNVIAAACEGESLVITDPKGELSCAMAPWLRSKGYDVYIFNLGNPAWGNCWNPVQEAQGDEEITALTDALINNTVSGGGKDNYFISKEKEALKALVYLLKDDFPPGQAHLRTLLSVVNWPPEALDQRFEDAYRSGRLTREGYEAWGGAQQANLENAKSGISSKLNVLRDPGLAKLLSRQEIDLSTLGRRKSALFCVLPVNSAHLRPVLSTFYYFLFRRLYGLAAERGGRLPVPTRFLLDEFANIGQIPGFTEVISTARSLGIKVQFVLQGLKQLTDAYGSADAENILANCPIQVFLGGDDNSTTTYFSRRLGEAAVEAISERQDMTVPGKHLIELPRRTQTVVKRALMEPEELSRMHPLAAVVLARWCLPLYLRKVDWEMLPQAGEIKQSAVKTLAEVVPRREITLELPDIPIPEAEEKPLGRERGRGTKSKSKPEPEANYGGGLADLFRPPEGDGS